MNCKIFGRKMLPLCAAMLLLFSCGKSFLNRNPLDAVSSQIFWQTPADAELALTGLYNPLYAGGYTYATDNYFMGWWDDFTDNAYSHDNYANSITIGNGGLNALVGGFQQGYYNASYTLIASVNTFVARVGGTGLDAATLDDYLGQAYCLRGFAYYNLGILYGAVPITLIDPTILPANTIKAKSTQLQVLQQSMSDLDSAISLLPDQPYTDGHIVKGTAMGLKLRLLMFQQDYTDALPLAKQIITGGNFSLNPNYGNNFIKPAQNNSNEIMFSVKFALPNQYHEDPSLGQLMLNWQELVGTPDLINAYECTDGLPIATSPLYSASNPYANRDPRMRLTFFFPGDGVAQGYPGGTYTNQLYSADFFMPKKWSNSFGGLTDIPSYGEQDDNDYVLMRYAEVLLLAAEADNELDNPSDACQYINPVRERAGMPGIATGLSQAAMRAAIRYEFRSEFALEGNRYFDLRRWGIAQQTLNGFQRDPINPQPATMSYPAIYQFWPIPQDEIDKNAPLLIQTPGY